MPFHRHKYGYGNVRFEVIKWSILTVLVSRMAYLVMGFMDDDDFVKYY